ncbi:DUF4397 domain-containing protein [Pelobium manganitolerans]|uniref:DUF4397 domain-containing protein n=1 Tax=Pelobium manganitolerans TaxID=1842495 RepID=UPI003FA34C60
MTTNIKSLLVKSLALVLMAVVFFSCAPEEVPDRVGEAQLRIVNAVADDLAYGFYINDTLKTGAPLAFGEASGYLNVSAGTNQVYTERQGQLLPTTKFDFYLDQNKRHTLFLAGKPGTDSLIYIATVDRSTALTDTMATVRFINVSADAKDLNLVFQKNLVDSVNAIKNINYRTASAYTNVRAGNYFLRVKLTTGSSSLANLDNISLDAGKVYTVWTKGLVKGADDKAVSLKILAD